MWEKTKNGVLGGLMAFHEEETMGRTNFAICPAGKEKMRKLVVFLKKTRDLLWKCFLWFFLQKFKVEKIFKSNLNPNLP